MNPAEMLIFPVARAARIMALSQLDAAVAAYQRVDKPDDLEALHDFRVALRRLRSCMQAYQSSLSDTVSGKSQKQLRRLARTTNEARDTEVWIEWLRSQEQNLQPRQRIGWLGLLERLEARKSKAYEEIRARVDADFRRLEQRLRKQLQTYSIVYDLNGQARDISFAEASGIQIKQLCKEMGKGRWRIDSSSDDEAIHANRIRVKRLRYLLEPLQEQIEDGKAIIKQLKDLQDLLGHLHDIHLCSQEIVVAVETAAAARACRLMAIALQDEPDLTRLHAEQRRNEHAGLVLLARLAKTHAEALFADLAARYLDDGAQVLVRRIALAGQALIEKARNV